MIISHTRKFIFIKTKKTASSSMEVALGKYCEKEDVITPLTDIEESYRRKYYVRGAQNYILPPLKWRIHDYIRLLKGKRPIFYNHMSAEKCKKYISEQKWKE